MDLRTDYPYSLLRKGIINSYPSLQKNLRCDVAVIGAGITGALIAWHLNKAGINAAVFDKRHAGMGSTAASTGMLQYEIDIPLHQLIDKVGYKNAVRSYQLCRQSIFDLETICKKLKTETTFRKRNSFQYASYKKDTKNLEKEYAIRKKIGIPLEWMEEKEIVSQFGFRKSAGLYSEDAGEIDAYTFTHALLQDISKRGTPVFDHTEIISIRHHKRNVELLTAGNKKIISRKLIIACGYESQRYLPQKVEKFLSTYAIVSEPRVDEKWYKGCLIWETATPYLYMRTTVDNRIIIGGMDDEFSDAIKREKALPSKSKSLERSFKKLFPSVPFTADFQWAGTFASTKDGLPYIGSVPRHPDTYFALGFGGNGITFSVIAAQIIRDILCGKRNEDARIFSFTR
jgi:glycine/D-amino acid oxidase-like deaminating enzyme